MTTTAQISTRSKNYNAVDLMRFICAMMIVIVHVSLLTDVSGYPPAVQWFKDFYEKYLCTITVPFFFLTSGFFLFKKTSYENYDVRYAITYLKHIIKLYVIYTLIYLPLSVIRILTDPKGIVRATAIFVRDIFFNGSYIHLWYLPSLIVAVALVAFLLYKRVKPGHIILIAAVFYCIGLLFQSWFGVIAPLQSAAPELWNFMRLVRKIIVTTRNGLCEGFLFVALGAYIGFYQVRIKARVALPGFVLSMIAMFIEYYLLDLYNFPLETNYYLFLVPVAFFLFMWLLEIELPNSPRYKWMRLMSGLVYYTHYLMIRLVMALVYLLWPAMLNTPLVFVLAVAASIGISQLILTLSQQERFKVLRNLY